MKIKCIRNDQDKIYLIRWNLFEFFGISAKVHCFVGPDWDGQMHTHPFFYFNLLLTGSYIEVTEQGPKIRKAGYFSFHKPDYKHRIDLFKYDKDDEDAQGSIFKPCLTLFITWKDKERSWGYDCSKGIVDYKKFDYKKGCE